MNVRVTRCLAGCLLIVCALAVVQLTGQPAPAPALAAPDPPLPGPPGYHLLFSDNFNDGSPVSWSLPAGWTPAQDGNDWRLSAPSAGKAALVNRIVRSEYLLRARVRLAAGTAALWVRQSADGKRGYRLEVASGGLALYRFDGQSQTPVGASSAPVSLDAWHAVELRGTLGHLEVLLDGSPRIDVVDPAPWLAGSIGLETLGASAGAEFDDIEIWAAPDGERPWTQTNGPPGGVIATIELDPSQPDTLYAGGTGGAIFKSTDAGASWTMLDPLVPPYTPIRNIVISPANRQDVYVLAVNAGAFRSTDAGATWQQLPLPESPTSIALGSTGSPLLAGTGDGRAFASADRGGTWTEITGDLPAGETLVSLAVTGASEYWAGTSSLAGGGLYHTINGGVSWTGLNVGQAAGTAVTSIFVDPEDSTTLYVGFSNPYQAIPQPGENRLFKITGSGASWAPVVLTNPGGPRIIAKGLQDDALYLSNGGNVFRSTDGQNWTQLTSKWLVLDPIDMAVDPVDSQLLYLPRQTWGILKSADAGSTWTSINQGLRNTVAFYVTTGRFPGDDTLYTNGHVSRDGGDTWQFYLDRGIDHPFIDEITASPFDPEGVWFVGDVGSAYVSANAGDSWTKTLDQMTGGRGFRFGSVYSAAASPSDPDRIYANRNGMGIFRSDNGGGAWRFLYPSLVDYTYSLAIHPTQPDTLFSGYTPKPFEDWAMVRKTIDAGLTWTTTLSVPHSSGITSVVFDPQNPNRLYAGSTGSRAGVGGQIYTSGDGGATWGKLNEHFTLLTVWGQPQLIADPAHPNVAYAATWLGGTWKTADAGSTWTLLGAAPLSSTALSQGGPEAIYSADRTRPWVWRSEDGGATWVEAANFESSGAFLVNRVLAAGEVVYASTFGPSLHGGKLYRHSTAGGSWTDITGTLPRSVLDIAVSPINPQVIYVTTHIHGAYKSVNGGATWDELPNFPDIGGYDIELDPFDPGIVYAAGMGAVAVPDWVMPGGYTLSDPSGVYFSPDGGLNWTRLLATSGECRAIRAHRQHQGWLYAAALGDGLQVTTDGGATWKSYNAGLDTPALTAVALSGDAIYAGTQGAGIYAGSVNDATGAVTWDADRSNKPVPAVHNVQIAVDPTNSSRIYVSANPGGLFRSDDGGATFYDKNFLTPSVVVDDPRRQGYYTFALNPDDPAEVWLGTWGKGIYKSYDGMDFDIGANGVTGTMWGKEINAILIRPGLGVLAATEQGVYLSSDGGATWSDFSAGLDTPQVRTLNVTAAGKLLAGTAGYEMYYRTPSDAQWSQFDPFGDWGKIWPIWDNRPNYQFTSVLFHPTDPGRILMGTFPAGIFRSDDGGQSWLESNTGWTFDGVFSLVHHPENPEIVYAGTYNGVNRSLDGGLHWEKWDAGWPAEQWVYTIAFDPRDPDVMYACSKNGEKMGRGRAGFHGIVMKSTNGGASWFPITAGLDVNQEFYRLIVDERRPDTLYLATQWEGVFISRDGGGLWLPWNDGLTNNHAATNGNHVSNPMALSADGSTLYFGTVGSSVYRRRAAGAPSPRYLPLVMR